MDFCSPGFLRRCGLLVAPCSFIGANEPTGACGGPKCPSLAFAGLSVGSGKPIPHALRAGTPIVGVLTSPGLSALYPGGPRFGTSADICSKTLLCVMFPEEARRRNAIALSFLFIVMFLHMLSVRWQDQISSSA